MMISQPDLFAQSGELGLVRFLLADLHDALLGKVTRFRHLTDLSGALGSSGTMLPCGETTYAAWTEARSSFIHGNYVATVLLCQGLAEHLLAAHLDLGINGEQLPKRPRFQETLRRCRPRGLITDQDGEDLKRLMELRNPLSHYRSIDDPSNLSRRALLSGSPAEAHLQGDAGFAISMAARLLALPAFRLGQ
jgi:hypothetical protein